MEGQKAGKKEKQKVKQDMGSGSIPRLMLNLAIPAVVAQLINMLYNIVDRIYIGHIPDAGASALTGVGLFLPILMMINAFAMLTGSGGAPRAAIAMGKNDRENARNILGIRRCADDCILRFRATAFTAFRGERRDIALCAVLCPNLYSGNGFRNDCNGNESLYYNPGICKNQYDNNGSRRGM